MTRWRSNYDNGAGSPGRILALLLLIGSVAGCSSGTSQPDPTDLIVRVFVDSDGGGTWDENDIPLSDVEILLDDSLLGTSDSEGWVTFESVSTGRHTIRLDGGTVEDLASHAVVCSSPSQTVELDDEAEVVFCFRAVGFLEVDVSEEDGGQ